MLHVPALHKCPVTNYWQAFSLLCLQKGDGEHHLLTPLLRFSSRHFRHVVVYIRHSEFTSHYTVWKTPPIFLISGHFAVESTPASTGDGVGGQSNHLHDFQTNPNQRVFQNEQSVCQRHSWKENPGGEALIIPVRFIWVQQTTGHDYLATNMLLLWWRT